MAELTDEQIAAEERFLEGIPRWNIGAYLKAGACAICYYPFKGWDLNTERTVLPSRYRRYPR